MDVAIALRTLFNHHLHQHHCHNLRSILSLASSWKLQPHLLSAGFNRVSLLISQLVHQSQEVVLKRRFSFFGVEKSFFPIKILKCTFNETMFCCLAVYWKSPYCLNPCMPWALSHRWAVDDHFLTQNSATWKIYSALSSSIYEPQTVKAWFFNRYDL